jgi:hypothetical protein
VVFPPGEGMFLRYDPSVVVAICRITERPYVGGSTDPRLARRNNRLMGGRLIPCWKIESES